MADFGQMRRTGKKKNQVVRIETMLGGIFLVLGIVWLAVGLVLTVLGVRAQESVPWEITGAEDNAFFILGMIFDGLGLVFTAIGGVVMSLGLRKEKRRKNMMASGKRVYAEVTGGYLCRNYSVNDRHPYKIECRYRDDFTGQTYLYSSDYTWADPELYMGQQIVVYINESDMSQYYVDVDSLQDVNPDIYDYR